MAKKQKQARKTSRRVHQAGQQARDDADAADAANGGVLVVPDTMTLIHQQSQSSRTAENLCTVMVSRAEDNMQAELKRCEAEEQEFAKAASAARESATKALQAAAEEACAEMHDAAKALVKALKVGKVSFQVSPTLPGPQPGSDDRPPKDYVCSFSCAETRNGAGRCGDFSFSRTYRFKLPTEVRDLLRESWDATKSSQAAREEAMEWKRRLARIPQYERKLRRRIAENELSADDYGSAQLERLDEVMRNDIMGISAS